MIKHGSAQRSGFCERHPAPRRQKRSLSQVQFRAGRLASRYHTNRMKDDWPRSRCEFEPALVNLLPSQVRSSL